MVEARSNIAWYMPKASTTKLLFIFQQIAEWKNGEQAQGAQSDPAGTHGQHEHAGTEAAASRDQAGG